jgi:hypothetical protein
MSDNPSFVLQSIEKTTFEERPIPESVSVPPCDMGKAL